MFGITEKHSKLKGNSHFIRFKDGAKFVVYFFDIYLATTLALSCLGAIIRSPLLMMPLAVMISNTVAWILMGITLMATYKMAVNPLFHLAKDLVSKIRFQKKEKSEEEGIQLKELQKPILEGQERPVTLVTTEKLKTPGADSGTATATPEIAIAKDSFVTVTEKGDYKCWLSDRDITGIAENHYNMMNEGKPFDKISNTLSKCKFSLKRKREEFVAGLKNDEQSRANADDRNRIISGNSSDSSDSGVSEISSPIDVVAYEANHRSQNLTNQTQAGNYNYLLQQADIANLARVVHNLDPEAHEITGSNAQLKLQLKQFKSKVRKNSETQKLTLIISLQNGHWVTLCVIHCNKQFSAYYYDSLNGKQYRSTFSKILQEELNMCKNNIRFFEGKTQSDGSNCGIFALQAASTVNQMLDMDKSLDDIDEMLLEYKPTGGELKKLRERLAEILNNDEVNSGFVVTDSTPINNASHCSIL